MYGNFTGTYSYSLNHSTFRTAFHLHCDCLLHLHTRSATTKALSRALVDHRLASQAVVGDNAQHESSEPDDQAEERESLRSTPLSAVVAAAQAEAAPSPRAAAPGAVEPDH